MSAAGTIYVDALAFWSPLATDWPSARSALRGEGALLDPPARRPSPELLAPTERRRAPDTVAIALEVAARATAEARRTPLELACVFASAHGDLAINDYMCATLADDPLSISPTKFHNSVHNAAAGYWTIGTGCMQASTALTAFKHSFAHGLFEAISQATADRRPLLLVAYDIAACGALASVTESRGMLAVAMVLSPDAGERTLGALDWSLQQGATTATTATSAAARALAENATSDALPLFERIANGNGTLTLALGDTLGLALAWSAR